MHTGFFEEMGLDMILSVVPESAQHIGERVEQQDSFGFSVSGPDPEGERSLLAVVCDGMGGMPMGRESSRLAVTAFIGACEVGKHAEPAGAALTRAAFAANDAVLEMAGKAGFFGRAGTTLAAVVIEKGSLYWISVGDSRVCLFRNGRLEALSRDHNVAARLERLVEKGKLSPEGAMSYRRPDALTSFIGIAILKEYDLSEKPVSLQDGDIVLLCTDGLYNSMTNEETEDILLSAPRNAVQGYIAGKIVGDVCKKKLPFQDNITILVMRIKATDKP